MRNIWLVIKHDLSVTLRQRSFWVLTFIMPLILVGVNAYYFIGDSGPAESGQEASGAALAELPPVGLVDPAGLIESLPEGLPLDLFVRFADEAAARAALEAGTIDQYVTVPADYVAQGHIDVYDEEFQIALDAPGPLDAFGGQGGLLNYLIAYNLVGDGQVAAALQNPVPLWAAEMQALQPPSEEGTNGELASLVASVLPLVYYFLLVMGSTYLMRSVVAEKENRTAELLLLSIDSRQLLVGKIAAMSLVTLMQVVVWVAGGTFVLRRGAQILAMGELQFPPGFMLWAILFLVFGYLLFASIMVAGGALANNVREGGQLTWLLVIPLMPTLMFGQVFVEEPHGVLSVALSLFPFSAPSAMVTRLAIAPVPLWQVLLSLGGLAATAYVFLLLASRFFRAGNLLSQEAFNWRRLLTGWQRTG
jgi:ABC-2 type transport system permease protein